MKHAFSLLELIFAIVVIGIIASFAVPKYLDTRDHALATTIKRDVITTTSSIQNEFLINRKITKIEDLVTLNTQNWKIENNKITFNESDAECMSLEVKDNKIKIEIPGSGNICEKLKKMGISQQDIDLI